MRPSFLGGSTGRIFPQEREQKGWGSGIPGHPASVPAAGEIPALACSAAQPEQGFWFCRDGEPAAGLTLTWDFRLPLQT